MKPTQPYAVFSCDVDPVDSHLQGYGFADVAPCDLVYRKAVPRAIELFDELGIRGVFFFLGRDANDNRRLLRDITSAGHEVASHSMTHPVPFRILTEGALVRETQDSRTALSDASASDVIGFRAPAWDVDTRILAAVRRAGYHYDASVFPSPALLTNRLAVYWRGTRKQPFFSMDLLRHAFASRHPRLCNGSARGLTEFPIAVTSPLRVPVYHTMSHLTPTWLFGRVLQVAVRSRFPLCYVLHAVDLLDLHNDGVDPRLARHPGMALPLALKAPSLRRVLSTIARIRQVVTYRQALADGLAP